MFTVMIASRGRPDQTARVVESIRQTEKHRTQIILGLDEDDVQYPKMDCEVMLFRNMMAGQKWFHMQAYADGEYLMIPGDDHFWITKDWDEKLAAYFPKDKIAAVMNMDDPDGNLGNNSTNYCVHRKWHELVGFCPPFFQHYFVDTWTGKIAEMIDRSIFAKDVVIDHRHVKYGKAPYDETYRRRPKPEKHIWEATEPIRRLNAEKLRKYIDDFHGS
jgi:hypothetical protein